MVSFYTAFLMAVKLKEFSWNGDVTPSDKKCGDIFKDFTKPLDFLSAPDRVPWKRQGVVEQLEKHCGLTEDLDYNTSKPK